MTPAAHQSTTWKPNNIWAGQEARGQLYKCGLPGQMDSMDNLTLDLDRLTLDTLRSYADKGGPHASVMKYLRPLFQHPDSNSKDVPTMLSGACELIQRRKVMRLWSERKTRSLFLVFSTVPSDATHGVVLGQSEPVCSSEPAVVSIPKSMTASAHAAGGGADVEEKEERAWEVTRKYCKHLLAVHLALAISASMSVVRRDDSTNVDDDAVWGTETAGAGSSLVRSGGADQGEVTVQKQPYVEQVERDSYWRMIATGRSA